MREHQINHQNNFIMGWYADDTSFCDELIDLHLKSPRISGEVGSGQVNKEIKDSTDSFHQPPVLGELQYGSVLSSCIDAYVQRYNCCGTYGISIQLETWIIQHYNIGGGFKVWHSERMSGNFPICNRQLVFMTYLNTVKDGGTEFLYQNSQIEAVKGLTLIWPADWTHTHRGIISNTKEKTIVTGWIHLNGAVNENSSM